MNENRLRYLEELCEVNGRILHIRKDGDIETADYYYGTDYQRFKTIDEAVTWEEGYVAAQSMVGDMQL